MKKAIIICFILAFGSLLVISEASATIMNTTLINQGIDPDAAGTIYWNNVSSSFSGNLNVSGLDVLAFSSSSGWGANGYQIKIEQNWAEDGGKYLGSVGRVWDDTASTNLDGLTQAQMQELVDAGHSLVGYLMFGYFMTVGPNTVAYYADNVSAAQMISTEADGSFNIPFYANFSWHTIGDEQNGFISMLEGSYDAAFLMTRQNNYTWVDPLVARDVEFTIDHTAAPVPEPATMLLLGSGLVGLAGLRSKLRMLRNAPLS